MPAPKLYNIHCCKLQSILKWYAWQLWCSVLKAGITCSLTHTHTHTHTHTPTPTHARACAHTHTQTHTTHTHMHTHTHTHAHTHTHTHTHNCYKRECQERKNGTISELSVAFNIETEGETARFFLKVWWILRTFIQTNMLLLLSELTCTHYTYYY